MSHHLVVIGKNPFAEKGGNPMIGIEIYCMQKLGMNHAHKDQKKQVSLKSEDDLDALIKIVSNVQTQSDRDNRMLVVLVVIGDFILT